MELKQTKVFVPTDVKLELPIESSSYLVINPKISSPFEIIYKKEDNIWWLGSQKFKIVDSGITHWLKEVELFSLTKEELERVIGDAYEAGVKYETQSIGSFLNDDIPNKEQYINQILK